VHFIFIRTLVIQSLILSLAYLIFQILTVTVNKIKYADGFYKFYTILCFLFFVPTKATWSLLFESLHPEKSMGSATDIISNGINIGHILTDMTLKKHLSQKFDLSQCLIRFWIIGSILFFMWNIIKYIKSRYILKRWMHEPNCNVQEIFNKVLDEYNIDKRRICLKQCSIHISPGIYGLNRGICVIPDIYVENSNINIEGIMRHECQHYLRKDNLVKFFLFLVNVLFWFNPIIPCIRRKILYFSEIICDERALRGQPYEYLVSYKKTLITALNLQINMIYSLTGNNYSGFSLNNSARIKAIFYNHDKRKNKLLYLVLFFIFFFVSYASYEMSASSNNYILKSYLLYNREIYNENKNEWDEVDFEENLTAVILREYKPYGISYNTKSQEMLYNGKQVSLFEDSFINFTYTNIGELRIIVNRNKEGEIVNITSVDGNNN